MFSDSRQDVALDVNRAKALRNWTALQSPDGQPAVKSGDRSVYNRNGPLD